MTAAEAAERILRAVAAGNMVAEVLVGASSLPGVAAGARLLVWADGAAGGLGAPELDARAVELARDALRDRRPVARTLSLPGGECSLLVEPHGPPDELVVVGAGHIAQPLCRIGATLGFRVVVLDDRPGFATRERFPEAARVVRADFADPFRDVPLHRGSHLVLVTRGHKYDFEALRDLLRHPGEPAYIGMVGSQRRVRAALEQLLREGVGPERLRAVHAPIGLDLGAETPAEIALAIVAEIVRLRRGGSGASLRERARVVERWLGGVDSGTSGGA